MAEYTIDLCEGGTASANVTSYGRLPERAFNNTNLSWSSDSWEASGAGQSSLWIQYEFAAAQVIDKIIMSNAPDTASNIYMPATFEVLGSLDGIEPYTVIKSFSGVVSADYTPLLGSSKEFILDNTTTYKFIRIDTTESTFGSLHIQIGEIEMKGKVFIANSNRPDNISELFHTKQTKMRGKAAEGFIRATLSQFFTSKDFIATPPVYTGPTAGYSFGGLGALSGETDEYVPDTWTGKTNMAMVSRQYYQGVNLADKGYVFAGWNLSSALQDTDEYVPDTWASKTDCPAPARYAPSATAILGKGYLMSGQSQLDCDEYVPDTWASKTDALNTKGGYSIATTILDKGYIWGGTANKQSNDEYNPDTWTEKTDIPSPGRNYSTATTINDKGYIFGGNCVNCDEYILDTWTAKTDAPRFVKAAGAVSIRDKGYVFGGASYLVSCHEYVPDTWTTKADMPSPGRSAMATCAL